jgi:hypothetical protein
VLFVLYADGIGADGDVGKDGTFKSASVQEVPRDENLLYTKLDNRYKKTLIELEPLKIILEI